MPLESEISQACNVSVFFNRGIVDVLRVTAKRCELTSEHRIHEPLSCSAVMGCERVVMCCSFDQACFERGIEQILKRG